MNRLLASSAATLIAATGLLGFSPPAGAMPSQITPLTPSNAIMSSVGSLLQISPGSADVRLASSNTNFRAESPAAISNRKTEMIRTASYKLNFSFRSCASYTFAGSISSKATGPALTNVHTLVALATGNSTIRNVHRFAPATYVGQTRTHSFANNVVSGSDAVGGVSLVYAASTASQYKGGISTGHTFGTPSINVVENASGCSTSTTAPQTTTTAPAPNNGGSSTTQPPFVPAPNNSGNNTGGGTTGGNNPWVVPTDPTTGAPQATPKQELEFSIDRPKPGQTIKITGDGFKARSNVKIDYKQVELASVTTNSAGAFSAEVTIPASAAGWTTFTATGKAASGKELVKSAQLYVLAKKASQLALTGPKTTPLIAVTGMSFIAAGSLISRRQRRRVRR